MEDKGNTQEHPPAANQPLDLLPGQRSLRPSAGETIQAAARSHRVELDTEIEFVGDFDIVKAYGVNLSESGICFELEDSLLFEMRFARQGKVEQRRAQLIWVKNVEGGRSRVGFRFVPA
jgi:hypothetical protein